MRWSRQHLEATFLSILAILLLNQPPLLLAQSCYTIDECTDNTTNSISKYTYDITVIEWQGGDDRSGFCPDSDNTIVRSWEIRFIDMNENTITGQFCSIETPFNSSITGACTSNGVLIFPQVSNVSSQSGFYIIELSATDFYARFFVRYNPTGVHALNNTVIYTPGSDTTVSMTWLIHLTTNNLPEISIYFQGEIIVEKSTVIDESKYHLVQETSVCFGTTGPEGKPTVYTLTDLNPTFESAGVYEAMVDGPYSDAITIVYNGSAPVEPSSSPLVSVTPSESFIPESMSMMTSPTPFITPSPNTTTVDDINTTMIIAVSVVGAVAVVTVIVVLIVILMCVGIRKRRKRRGDRFNEEFDGPSSVNPTYTQQLSVSVAPPGSGVDQQQQQLLQPTTTPVNHIDTVAGTAHSSGNESSTTVSNAEGQHEQQRTDHTNNTTTITNTTTTTITTMPGAAEVVEALNNNTQAMNTLIETQRTHGEYARRTAENTGRSVEIQLEQVDLLRDNNERLEQNIVQEGNEPSSPNEQDLVYNPDQTNNIETEPSTSSMPANDHTHSIHSESRTHSTSSRSQSPTHPASSDISPRPESPASDIDQTTHHQPRESDDDDDDIVGRGPEPVPAPTGPISNEPSPTSDGTTSNEPLPNGIPRSVPVKTEKHLRKINIKIMGVHPEWKELARALHVDDGIIDSIARSQNQHNRDDRSRLQDVLVKWKRKGGQRTWKIIHTALVEMKRNDVAAKVANDIDDLDSNVPFDDDGYCDIMAQHLNGVESEWYTLALHLDIDYKSLEEIEGTHKTEICLSRMLLKWWANKGTNADIVDIEDSLERIGNREMADRLREDEELHQV